MEPPDLQLFRGRAELERYFGSLRPRTLMRWHRTWFDPDSQRGVGEYTFGAEGRPSAIHGVAVITVAHFRITEWREYQRPGPPSFEALTAVIGKEWRWHGGNYL